MADNRLESTLKMYTDKEKILKLLADVRTEAGQQLGYQPFQERFSGTVFP